MFCFGIGYPVEEAEEYIACLRGLGAMAGMLTSRKYPSNQLPCAAQSDIDALAKLIAIWDASLDYGYSLFADEPDFRAVMEAYAFKAFEATRRRAVPLSRLLTRIYNGKDI